MFGFRRAAGLVLAGLLAARTGSGAPFDVRGQLSVWLGAHDRPAREASLGLRYIPVFSLKTDFGKGVALDAEASANIYGASQGSSFQDLRTRGDIKPYRIWFRLATDKFEARLGLQKINFGSAMILRPLMWFDRIDPNDPLQLTDGVYGLLLKYTFVSNTNVWLWGLLGNDEPKGWETVPSFRTSPEYGGRVQIPAFSGELALSYHHRRMDTGRSLLPLPAGERNAVPEDRIGVDGRWDIGPGVSVEAVLSRQGFAQVPLKYQKTLNLGLDYTLSLGNGLHLMAEHLIFDASAEAWSMGQTRSFSALTLDYPLGLLDRLHGVVFRNWETSEWYRFLTWQRTYDRWSIFLIGFWNPDTYQIFTGRRETALFAGKGFQIMVVFNH